jgi:hypothetical protein
MGNEGSGGRKLNVARELLLLAKTVEGLRLAAQQKIDGSRHRDKPSDLALVMLGGLHVIRDRIGLVARILMGKVNAAEIVCEENEAGLIEDGPGIVPEWSAEEKAQRLEAEWRLACSRRFLERPHGIAGFARNKKPDDRSN